MEALVVRAARAVALACLLSCTMGASHRTQNFIVTARSKVLAREIAEAAEQFRRELAIDWLGHELTPWREPCPIRANVNPALGAGGATSFLFDTAQHRYARPVSQGRPAGRPYGWEMTLQGSRERVLDSVLPHEITHTIFATHFGRPLPRWADEGACTTVEHHSEKSKQHRFLYEFLTTNRGIPFNRMFAMTEYPADILPLYSQGFSLARYFIAQGGRKKFVQYVGRGLDSNDWTAATKEFYGFESLSDLQVTWLEWVRQGSPENLAATPPPRANTARPQPEALASAEPRGPAEPGTTTGHGWYAALSQRAKQTATSTPNQQTASASWTPHASSAQARLSSRPEPASRGREVMIEWGRPSPILAPALATHPDRSSQSATRLR